MALRDQPYIPLYIQDIMTDEKLNECCASTHGIYIKGIMCLMHKSEEYGKILLRQKYQQTTKQSKNFAKQLVKHLPYSEDEIENAIDELIKEGVCYFENDYLCQKRMIRDNAISVISSSAGKKGADSTHFAKAKPLAKPLANSEYENEYENEIDSVIEIKGVIKDYWEKWKNYKKSEFNFNFNSEVSEEESKKDLISLSGNNADEAIRIIDYSIACGYKKFVKPEQNGKQRTKKQGATPDQISRAAADVFGIDSPRNSKEHGED